MVAAAWAENPPRKYVGVSNVYDFLPNPNVF